MEKIMPKGSFPIIYKKESQLPKKVAIDACTNCQLDCCGCWRNCNPDDVKLGYLKFEDFKNFIDKHPFIITVELASKGEIFLNPQLIDIIKYGYEKNVRMTAWSGVNGNYIPDEVAEALVKYNFYGLAFSIDGACQETYSIYRTNGNYDQVIENIEKINFYKKKYNSMYPLMTYKMVVFGHNEHEIPLVIEKAKKLNMDYKFDNNWIINYSPIQNVELAKKLTKRKFLGGDNHIENMINYYKTKQNIWFYCADLFMRPIINFDGELFACPCCERHFGINVFEQGMMKALNNIELIKIRELLLSGCTDASGTYCEGCCVFENLKYDEDYQNRKFFYRTKMYG